MPANEVHFKIASFSHQIDRTNGFKPTATKTQLSACDRVGILQTFAVWRPLLSLAGMARSYACFISS
jgi:hypothetical protein